ncbi:hypothetical protein IW262DRAFT_270806 [Armillaria fumosa]|nr:hypothetical protein IW262DRAFT_270806 [Armillaria fumosa]
MGPILITAQSSAVLLLNIMAEYLDQAPLYKIHMLKAFLQLGSVYEDSDFRLACFHIRVRPRTKEITCAIKKDVSEHSLGSTTSNVTKKRHLDGEALINAPITETGCGR